MFVDCSDGRTVLDAITQEFYGRDPNVVYVSYDAVRTAIRRIDAWMATRKASKLESVAFPKIGAGLANGEWDVIAAIIEEEAKTFQAVVYTL